MACGGRVPSDAKTAHLAKGYFKKYGNKYKDTVFHNNGPAQVEVKRTQELQRSLANSFAILQLKDGQEVPVILTLLNKFPRGWRISSWEWVRAPEAAPPPSSENPNPPASEEAAPPAQ
jgi:hypothetical protein